MELFLLREKRAEEKFGKPRDFRIWRINAKTLQVDFGGGHTELKSDATGDHALKRCIDELGANDLMLSDLKKDLAAFRKEERPETLPNVLFFRDGRMLKVLMEERLEALPREDDASVLKLARKLKVLPDRLLATYRIFQVAEKPIQTALGR